MKNNDLQLTDENIILEAIKPRKREKS